MRRLVKAWRGKEDEIAENAYDLKDFNDEVGEKTKICFELDYLNREAAFMYINGELIIGNPNSTHAELVNQWLAENGQEENAETFTRPAIDDVMQNAESVGFGHIDCGIAFVETCQGCTMDEVAAALKQKYSKVYDFCSGSSVIRLANQIKGGNKMSDFGNLLDKKNLFYKGLEDLSKFRSIMAYSKDPEMQQLLQNFDQGFTHLRDVFQKEMDNKAANFHTAETKTRLRKLAAPDHPTKEELQGKKCGFCKKELDNVDPNNAYKVPFSGEYFCCYNCFYEWQTYMREKYD